MASARRIHPRLAFLLVVLFGAWTRISGFSKHELWFDDAWVAVPGRVPISEAVHMVNTTPLFSLFMRQWMIWGSDQTWWLQLPAFVTGLMAIVAVYRLIKYFNFGETLSLLGALVIAASPIVIDYSSHLKQYNLDIIFTSLILWLAERWRRNHSMRGAVELALASSLALLTSASTIVVVAPVLAVAAISAWRQRARRTEIVVLGGLVGATFVLEWMVWLSHLSHGLYVGWRHRGYLLDTSNLHRFVFSLQTMGSQFFHWMLAMPTGHRPDPDHHITVLGLTISATAALVLVALVAPSIWQFIRRPFAEQSPFLAPALALSFSALLALVRRSPFGGGRTDEVIYPALLLLVASAFMTLAPRVRQRFALAPRVLVVASVIALSFVGLTNRSHYPAIDIKSPVAQMEAVRLGSDGVVIDPWLGFTWAAADLPHFTVSREKSFFDWSQGFHINGDATYIFSENYFFPSWTYKYLDQHFSRLWYVAETGSPAWPATSANDRIYVTRNLADLLGRGWVMTSTKFVGSHVEVVLLQYSPGAVAN